ncbi:MAG TPA: hypothetical protein VLC28_10045 [Flavitalea sp.]|nr:hypothetical protein [Flavitalea sp.]
MPTESASKLYQHFLLTADVNKYHGNIVVLKTFMKMQEPDLRAVIQKITEQYPVKIFWFSELDFIADVSGQDT